MRDQLFRTPNTATFGIRHPILRGGPGPRVAETPYVASVVNAGGMGFTVAAGYDPHQAVIPNLAADEHTHRLAEADGTEKLSINTSLRDTHRVPDIETEKAVLAPEAQGVNHFAAYRDPVTGPIVRAGHESGDASRGTFDWCQSAVFADKVEPMAAIVDAVIDDARPAIARSAIARLDAATMPRP